MDKSWPERHRSIARVWWLVTTEEKKKSTYFPPLITQLWGGGGGSTEKYVFMLQKHCMSDCDIGELHNRWHLIVICVLLLTLVVYI